MSTLRRILTGSALAVVAVGMASANTISFSASYGLSGTTPTAATNFGASSQTPFTINGGVNCTGCPQSIGLAMFNTALGTLNSATITVAAYGDVNSLEFTAGSAGESFNQVMESLYIGVEGPNGFYYGDTSLPLTLLADSTPFSLTPGQTNDGVGSDPPILSGSNSNTTNPQNVTDLSDFEHSGGGTITLDVGALALVSTTVSSGNGTSTNSTDAGELITINYNYTPVTGCCRGGSRAEEPRAS